MSLNGKKTTNTFYKNLIINIIKLKEEEKNEKPKMQL